MGQPKSLSVTLQPVLHGAGVGLEVPPAPCGSEPWGAAGDGKKLSHSASCCPLTHMLNGEQRLMHENTVTKTQILSPFSLHLCPHPCLVSQSNGTLPLPLLAYLTSLLGLARFWERFYNFHLMTQCLLFPVPGALPGYSLCLEETTEGSLVSPTQATTVGHCVPMVPPTWLSHLLSPLL